MGGFDPQDSHRNRPQGAVAGGALVVAGGEAAVLLTAADQPLHPITPAVAGAVEGAGTLFGAQLGAGGADAAPPAVRPPGTPGVALVAHHPVRAQAGPTPAGPSHRALLHQLRKDGRLIALPGRQHQGHRLAVTL